MKKKLIIIFSFIGGILILAPLVFVMYLNITRGYHGIDVDSVAYEAIDKNSVELLNYMYEVEDAVIPSTIVYRKKTYNVVSINNYAFSSQYSMKTITIPESIVSIGDYAFQNCTGLTSIVIPSGVTKIGDYTFDGCKNLESITLPDNIEEIGCYAFSHCEKLKNLAIPKAVTKIGEYAFNCCYSLESIALPDGFTQIGGNAFSSCRSLTTIKIPKSIKSIDSKTFNGLSDVTVEYGGTIASWDEFSIFYTGIFVECTDGSIKYSKG